MFDFDSLPSVDDDGGAPSPEVPTSRAASILEVSGSRRWLFKGIGAAAAAYVGASFLDIFGGAAPEAFAEGSCWASGGFSYNSTCGYDYPTPSGESGCDNGCARSSAVSNTTFCYDSSYQQRHRTCGEGNTVSGHSKVYTIRENECYSSTYDGWVWYAGSCGCSYGKNFSCNDGWYSSDGGAYQKSICMTSVCA